MRLPICALRFVILAAAIALAGACGSVTPIFPDQTSVQFQITDLTVGTGTAAANGNTVTGTYSLWLYSDTATDHKGTLVNASGVNQLNVPFSDVLGSGATIPGFDQAIVGMAVGGTRRAIVPPSLAYGSQGSSDGTIPPNAALVFEIQLVSIQ